ncbi:MAG TPA: HAMP domain-containing sensor histidine kinase [Bacteroidota bacterium]|jgi:signal transduction histidine kinase|nr:HAMP domain-containing sensor histidine kinase [Bacteroidota bacterium]
MLKKLRISTKLLLTIFPLLLLGIGTSIYLNNRYQEQEMLAQAQASAQTAADILRESLVNMMTTRLKVDDGYLSQLASIRDLRNLHIHFRTDSLHLRDMYQDDERIARLRNREQMIPPIEAHEREVFSTGEPMWQRKGDMFNAIIPFKAVEKCQTCHEVPPGYVLGAAEMDISLERISAAVNSNWTRSLWIFGIFMTAALVLCLVVYHIVVHQNMRHLVDATIAIGRGNLTDEHLKQIHSGDELGDLARAFDMMRSELNNAQQKVIHTERLSMVGQMASSIVHDFRTPMSTINLAIESLQKGMNFTPEKTQEWYRMIRDAVQRMVTMAQELLDFSRGDVRLEKVEFPIPEFTHLLVKSVKPSLDQAHIKLKIEEKYSGTALVDPERLQRAFINIINNAQDAMSSGGILNIATGRDDGHVTFSIADTGKGIPPEIKDTIFDAFVTAGKKKGTGLGLAITKRIVDQHSGEIFVASESGKGTTFTIRIPLGDTSDDD